MFGSVGIRDPVTTIVSWTAVSSSSPSWAVAVSDSMLAVVASAALEMSAVFNDTPLRALRIGELLPSTLTLVKC